MMYAIRRITGLSDAVLVRLGTLAVLIVVLVGFGLVLPRVPPEVGVIAAIAPLAMLLVIGKLEYGILAILAAAAFVRASLPTGTQSRIVASLLLTGIFTGIWLARMLVIDKRIYLKPAHTNVPVVGMIMAMSASYLWSNAFRDPLVVVWATWPIVQLGAMAVMVLLPCAFLLTANCIANVRWLKIVSWIIILTGALSLVSDLAHLGFRFINIGGLFSLWFVSLAYGQILFNRNLSRIVRIVLVLMLVGWLYRKFVVEVYWVSGWLPPLIAIGLITLLRSRKAAVIMSLVVVVYLALNWGYYSGYVFARESSESGVTRLAAWQVNWRITGRHLLFGTGPAGYAAYYMSYFPTEATATHNNYIDILSQSGITGLFFVLWFLGALAWTGYKLCRRLRGTADFSEGFACATLAGCVGCIVAMGLGDWMFPFVYTQGIAGFDYAVYSWVLLGGMVALTSLVERERPNHKEERTRATC